MFTHKTYMIEGHNKIVTYGQDIKYILMIFFLFELKKLPLCILFWTFIINKLLY